MYPKRSLPKNPVVSSEPRFIILQDYEIGAIQAALNWVVLGGKPIVEVGGHMLQTEEIPRLADDLNQCIKISHYKDVYAFIMKDRNGWWQYGFYQYPWALEAMLFLRDESPCIQGDHRHWIQGLLFGYDPSAIHRFISSESHEQESRLRLTRDTTVCRERWGMVEICDAWASSVPPHSS